MGGDISFATTRWSVVLAARVQGTEESGSTSSSASHRKRRDPHVSELLIRHLVSWPVSWSPPPLRSGGCLSVPEGAAPMCHSNNDCDRSHGEVCEEGVCWGNPPPGPVAAVVSPPSTRQDLVAREIPQLSIPDYGWLGDLTLERRCY